MTVEKIAELTGHGNPIFTLELSQKPGILFTGGNDKGLVEWSLHDHFFYKGDVPGEGVYLCYTWPGRLSHIVYRFTQRRGAWYLILYSKR
jgi:hypothetical protein